MKTGEFWEWMAEFDKALIEKYGMSSEGFPDWGYWDSWNAGDTIEDAMEAWIECQEDNF